MSKEIKSNSTRTTEQPWLPERWDGEAEVIVVGYGGAGAIAAITARYAGASCIVLEKSAVADGGSTAVSGGHIHTAVGTDVDEWLEICRHGSYGATPVETLRPALQYAQETPAWLEKFGMNFFWTDEFGDAAFGPVEMLGFFPGGLFECVFDFRIATGQGLPLIKRLGANFATMIDAHECRDMALFGDGERGFGQILAGHRTSCGRRRKKRSQNFVDFRNQRLDHGVYLESGCLPSRRALRPSSAVRIGSPLGQNKSRLSAA